MQLEPTVHLCGERLAEYRSRLGETPALPLSALDAFLIEFVARASPTPPVVFDGLCHPTHGASLVAWSSPGSRVCRTIAGIAPWQTSTAAYWASLVREFARSGLLHGVEVLEARKIGIDAQIQPDGSDFTAAGRDPVIVALTAPPTSAQAAAGRIVKALEPLRWSLALVHESGNPAAFAGLAIRQDVVLLRMRDLSPFLFHSRLAMLWTEPGHVAREVMAQIARSLEGNVDYLSLLANNQQLQTKCKYLEQRMGDLEAALSKCPRPGG